MATLILDPRLEDRLKEQRRAWGADRYDEVWEGTYMMAPMPNTEHQQIVTRLVSVLQEVVAGPGRGQVFAGVNLAGFREDWENDYRVPDVAVFLHAGAAEDRDSHWRGAADFLVEITSPGDRTREKLAFYGRIGVKELLLIERQPWSLELYRGRENRLHPVAHGAAGGQVLASQSVPLGFQLVAGEARPEIQVTHPEAGRAWMV
jgi:Uma2 family endonuclease